MRLVDGDKKNEENVNYYKRSQLLLRLITTSELYCNEQRLQTHIIYRSER